MALDVTIPADADAAVQAAVERFGRIDVLVNNATSGGYFEELTPERISDLTPPAWGPMHVTRAALPVMGRQRSGHVLALSSGAGLAGFEFNRSYSACTDLLTPDSASNAIPSIDDYAERGSDPGHQRPAGRCCQSSPRPSSPSPAWTVQ